MAKSKFLTLLDGLLAAQQVLTMLDASGIDVNRLIGISNAQGPQGKRIQQVLDAAILTTSVVSRTPTPAMALPPPRELKRPKRKKKASKEVP